MHRHLGKISAPWRSAGNVDPCLESGALSMAIGFLYEGGGDSGFKEERRSDPA